MGLIVASALLTGLIALFYLFSKWRYQYWSRKGVIQLEPKIIFGDFHPVYTSQVPSQLFIKNLYDEYKPKGLAYIGMYNMLRPELLALDLEFIKRILTKDFAYFNSHGIYHHEKDLLTMHLFSTDGDKWKQLRTRLTPTFTSGKMKMMYEILLEKADVLNKVCGKFAEKGEIPIKETVARFTTDAIGNIAFGIEPDSLNDPNSKLRVIGRIAFQPRLYKLLLESIFPHKFLGDCGYRVNDKEVESYFTKVVLETIEYREKNNVQRKDFMQLMLQLKHHGNLNLDEVDKKPSNSGGKMTITNEEIITEAFLFFIAGFETSSSATTFVMIELAHNQDAQDKLRKEIHKALEDNGGTLPYDVLMSLPYLDMVLKEALRKNPVIADLPRMCTKSYKVEGTDLVIEKGTMVHIPVIGIHRDPELYPDPDKFNPENFSEENKAKRPDFAFLPFGEGPRMCLGLRYGVMQSKMAIVSILKDYKVLPHESIELPLKYEKGSIILAAEGDNKVKIEALKV